ERTIRNSAVDQHHFGGSFSTLPKKIRPDLGFGDDDQSRVDPGKCASDRSWEIEREVEDVVRQTGCFVSQFLSRRGGRGEYQGLARVLTAQAFQQFPDGTDLPNRPGMAPDAALQIWN